MKHYLLPESGTDYKANLHCHTNISDGGKSPAEVKQVYLDKGYSIVAYTDHDVLLDHSDLCDERFLALNGFELEVNESKPMPFEFIKCFHICMIAKEQDNLIQPCWHRSAYLFGNAPKYRDRVKFDESKPDFVRAYTPECFAAICKEGRENGFFVTYNHPAWSMEDYSDYMAYDGMDAMEYFNGGCMVAGYDDINGRVLDDMARGGKHVFCIGADDNHNSDPNRGRTCDAGVAWTVIRAPELEYRAVTRALEQGHFYASNGPTIKDVWLQDGVIHITCESADRIVFITGHRRMRSVFAPEGGKLTEATFDYRSFYSYFRIEVFDEKGNRAVTNPFFCDQIDRACGFRVVDGGKTEALD